MKKETVLLADYKRKIIWLDGEIGRKISSKFLKILQNFKKRELDEITFYVRGIGGDFSPTFSMIKAIRGSGLHIGCVAHDYVNSGCFVLIQAGQWTAALPKTRFGFHRAVLNFRSCGRSTLSSLDLIEETAKLELINLIQLEQLLLRGREVEEIFSLFYHDANLSVPQAIRLGLVDSYFDKRQFLKDGKIIKQISRNKTQDI